MKALRFLMAWAGLLAVSAADAADFSGVWERHPNPFVAGVEYPPPPGGAFDLKEPYARDYRAFVKRRDEALKRGAPLPDASLLCKPEGMPTAMAGAPFYIEFLHAKDKVVVLNEFLSQTRRIFLGVTMPPLEELSVGYFGYSVGRWEGDTLVVDTMGIREDVQFMAVPHSKRLRITERIRLLSQNKLENRITLEDPEVLVNPYRFTVEYRRVPGAQIAEYVCDNNRWQIDAKGNAIMRKVTP